MIMRQILYAVLVAILFANIGDAQAARRLSGSQIKAFFKGAFAGEYGKRRAPFSIIAKASGMLTGQYKGRFDTGRWWVTGNRLCMKWKKFDPHKDNCRHVIRSSSWYAILKASGQVKLRLRRK